jgi:hypothetical protein
MKAIRQIIDYLRGRGVLTLDQLKGLATQGFLPWEEIFGEEDPIEVPLPAQAVPQSELMLDETDEVSSRARSSGGKKGRDVLHKGPVLESEDICARLAGGFESWETELDGLVRIGRRLVPCDRWNEAAIAIRNAEADTILRALHDGISARDPSLEDLWNALSLEHYRDIVDEEGVHGPAVNAYRAILEVNDPAHLGKHAWLLKSEEVSRVANLKTAQRRILRGCGFSFGDHPDLFAPAIRRDRRGMAYWAFVLLYSSRRGMPGHRPKPGVEEQWPAREPPDDVGWMRAWAHAIAMDPDRGPPFMLEHDGKLALQPVDVSKMLADTMRSRSLLSTELVDLIDRHGIPQAAGTELAENAREPELVRLAEALAVLRDAVEAQGALTLPQNPDTNRAWAQFLEKWLRLHASPHGNFPSLQQLAKTTFGPARDLLCPKSWDGRRTS